MQNLENMNVFEILITQKLQKCPKDPFVRSALIYKLTDLSNYFRASMKHYELFMSFDDNITILITTLVCHARIARDHVPDLEPTQFGS